MPKKHPNKHPNKRQKTGPKPRPADELLGCVICVRVTPAERAALTERAERAEQTVSEYIRQTLASSSDAD